MAYRIELPREVRRHLEWLTARERTLVFAAIQARLTEQPATETRNRKRLRQNAVAAWELRVGDLRVFYDVLDGERSLVVIRAVGRKERSRLLIGGEEIIL
jgi:mRNA-degrading endonuclease RelE of RelBE toxin-antitoxin system